MRKASIVLLAGGLAAQHITLPPDSDLTWLLFVASLLLIAWRRTRLPACFGIGYAVFMFAGQAILEGHLDVRFAGDSMLTQVRIVGQPAMRGHSVVMSATPIDDARIPQRIRLRWFEPPVLPLVGDVWELELRLRPPRGTQNPNVFDHETWMFRSGYQGAGYVVPGKRNQLLWSGEQGWLEGLRGLFANRARLAAKPDTAAVLTALGVGQRDQVTREQWQQFAVTGTSHLMAISGLHIGLAATFATGLAYAILALVRRRAPAIVAAAVVGMLCAVLYAVVSGLGVPARRALLMLGVVVVGIVVRRQVDACNTVALAAALVYISDPIASLAPGFHLSFAAVVLLIWLMQRRFISCWPLFDPLRRLWVLQVFLLFGLLPLTVSWFQRFAVLATPVNWIAVPIFSFFVVPLVLMALATLVLFTDVATAALRIAGLAVDGVLRLVEGLASQPFADVTISAIEKQGWLFLLVPLFWVLLPPGWPGRRVAVIGVLALLSWRPSVPPVGCFDAWVLDVGQGLAVVIQTRNEVVLYDAGIAWRGGGSVAEQVLVPFLRSRKISRIDRFVVSHDDLDHSGGVKTIQAGHEIGQLLSGEPLQGIDSFACEDGLGWRADEVRFDALQVPFEVAPSGNDRSCLLRVTAGDYTLLLTGDIEAAAERWLVQHRRGLAADIALVPHHGSNTSSTSPFIDSVRPDYAVVSAGHANRWGFPKPEVVGRWRRAGAVVMNTAASGAVYFRTCARAGVVRHRLERQYRQRFWHATN